MRSGRLNPYYVRATATGDTKGQKTMQKFAFISAILGISLAAMTSFSYVVSSIEGNARIREIHFTYWSSSYFAFVVVGIFQTFSSVLIFTHAKNRNQEHPRIGWILTTTTTTLALFIIYFTLNYFNYVNFLETFLDPVILHVVVWLDLIFSIVSLLCSLVIFQKMLDNQGDSISITNPRVYAHDDEMLTL